MKTIIVCDQLVVRDESTQLVELFLEIFEEATIYTLAHVPGAILGPVEQRRIVSTFLSRIVKSKSDFDRWLFLAPGAIKSLKIPKDTNLVISVSRGFSHHIEVPNHCEHFCYLLGLTSAKYFSQYLKNFQLQHLERPDLLWVSSQSLKQQMKFPATVLPFFLKDSDYINVPRSIGPELKKYYLVNSSGIDLVAARDLVAAAQEVSVALRFVGADDHLQELKNQTLQRVEFWGVRCAGDLGLLFIEAKASIDFSLGPIFSFALASLYCQTPVATLSCENSSDFSSGDYGPVLSDLKRDSLVAMFRQLEGFYPHFSGTKLQALALKHSEVSFKGKILKTIKNWRPLNIKKEDDLAQKR